MLWAQFRLMVAKGGGETSHPRSSISGLITLKETMPSLSPGREEMCRRCSWTLSSRERVKTEEKEKRQMKSSQSKTDVSPHIHFVSMSKKGSRVLGGDDGYLHGLHFLLNCLVTGDLGPLASSSPWPLSASILNKLSKPLCKALASGREKGPGVKVRSWLFWAPESKSGCLLGPGGKLGSWEPVRSWENQDKFYE